MRKLFYLLVGLIVLAVVGIGVLYAVVPVKTYQDKILAMAQEKTGRKITIEGPVSLSVWPDIALKVEKVTVYNPAWAGSGKMITVDNARVGLKLLPLLRKEIIFRELTLVKPQIALLQKGAQQNWVLDNGAAKEPAPKQASGASASGAYQLNLGNIIIEHGQLSFTDLGQKAKPMILGDVNLNLSAGDLTGAVTVKGDATFDGKRHTIKAHVDSMGKESTPFTFSWKSEGVKADCEGTLSMKNGLQVNGKLDAGIDSLRTLMRTMAENIPNRVRVKGNIKLSRPADIATIDLSDAEFNMDDISLKGRVGARVGGAVPYAAMDLSTDTLDLTRYAPKPAEGGGASSAAPATASAEGWSDAPVDLSALKKVNADIVLSANTMRYKRATVAPAKVTITLKDGSFTAQMKQAGVYSGTADFTAKANASGAIALDVNVSGVQGGPLLKDFADYERLDGKLDGALQVTSNGNSQKQWVSHLNGTGRFRMQDGVYKGRDIAKMIRNVTTAFKPGEDSNESTKFSELSASFTITNGVVANHDLQARSPLLRVSGDGTANLPPQTINYTLKPTLAATLEGQGGKDDIAGLTVPIIITGPMTHPSWKPDLASTMTNALQNPEALKGTLKDAKGTLKSLKGGMKGKDLLNGLMGKQAEPSAPEAPAAAPATPSATPAAPAPAPSPEPQKLQGKDLLKGLLGGGQ